VSAGTRSLSRVSLAAMSAPRTPTAETLWRPSWPCPVDVVLRPARRGAGDPTFRTDPDGVIWRGLRTPEGVVTLRLESRRYDGQVHAAVWGHGSDWVLDRLPAMLGAEDDPSGFEPRHPVIVEAYRRHPHWRVARSGLVMESLVPAIIEQKVTGQEAFAGFRMLVHRFGERAPGPGAERGLWVQPSPEQIRLVPSWEWLRMHVDPARSRALVRAAQVASSLERTVGLDAAEVDRRLCSLPGIGVWTSAEVRFRAHGDADAVSFGDYHVAKDVGWALTGAPVDDDGMAELLEPYRPHRHRVQRLVELAGLHRPRRGPRMAPRRHLPASVERSRFRAG
jgi:3-methyladenine DNA glycosylase/8-oxoguanine DNA glycosylase